MPELIVILVVACSFRTRELPEIGSALGEASDFRKAFEAATPRSRSRNGKTAERVSFRSCSTRVETHVWPLTAQTTSAEPARFYWQSLSFCTACGRRRRQRLQRYGIASRGRTPGCLGHDRGGIESVRRARGYVVGTRARTNPFVDLLVLSRRCAPTLLADDLTPPPSASIGGHDSPKRPDDFDDPPAAPERVHKREAAGA